MKNHSFEIMKIEVSLLPAKLWLLLGAAAFTFLFANHSGHAADFEEGFRLEVSRFVESLNDDQRALCIHDVVDDRRWEMH